MKRPSGFTPQRPSTGEPHRQDSTRPARSFRPIGESAPAAPAEPIPFAPITRDTRDEYAERPDQGPHSLDHSETQDLGERNHGETRNPGGTQSLREAQKQRRRIERAEVRRFTAESRRRRRTWLSVLGGVVGLALLACVLAYTPILSVRTIQVEGAERVSSDAVVNDLAGVLGSPFPMVNESAIKAALVRYPLIESYSVEARPPSTLVIRLVERTPVGAVDTGDGFLLVDAAGVVVESGERRPDGYPLIAVDGGAEAESFAPAVAVLRSLPGELFSQVDTVTATTLDDVRFTLRDADTTVVWGSAEESSLKAYTLEALMKAQPDYSEYDVTSPDVAVVR
ncbi:FtsQ-type POTRA domain-containing protein [Mycetocola miduiensis]|uniref:Cell division protein FtsQ n=1 Tax=Mycetocola miduiensis TaxID=995034 RepID=A0A1I5A8G6_9MICO|nr:FtsQ-type POTRA domain-containing protein [Mycetocola miduiensis]SFN58762.1 cell division protein FtsQ [Mycetocola miduiensis]